MRRGNVVQAIFYRELSSYFSTPTGYVFIALFVFLSAIAAFWQERFFATNLANLDQLNAWFPYLLISLLPSISMSLWAEERRQGTEELLLTLPASDTQIVMGKYLAAVAIYSVSLLFSVSHVLVLRWLGSPDPGLMLSTYFGYWLMGSSLLAVAMVGSALSDNLTVAFILGALLCGLLAFLDRTGVIVQGGFARTLERLSVSEQFRDLASGIVTLGAVVYFVALATVAFYVNVVLLGAAALAQRTRSAASRLALRHPHHGGARDRSQCHRACVAGAGALGCNLGEDPLALGRYTQAAGGT